jgi:hypothetical protein
MTRGIDINTKRDDARMMRTVGFAPVHLFEDECPEHRIAFELAGLQSIKDLRFGGGRYQCAICGGVFEKMRSDIEAAEEAVGEFSTEPLDDVSVVCEDCNLDFRDWYFSSAC